jgi:PPOX class probable FMN-dependent enzyme
VNEHIIDTVEQYRELRGDAHQVIYDKSIAVVDEHVRCFLELSPFLTIASRDAEGRMDVSPKGDPPGFVKVLDDRTIAIPERPGNRRADTFTNVLQEPAVALICFVPGMDETMRINGSASVSTDPDLLATMEVNGHTPKLALVVRVEEAFIHCGKAPKRARLWDPDARIDRSVYPTIGAVMHDHSRSADFDRQTLIDLAQDDYDNHVY